MKKLTGILKLKTCCLCKKKIQPKGSLTDGNNAEPLKKGGRCCDDCNVDNVIPERLARHFLKRTA